MYGMTGGAARCGVLQGFDVPWLPHSRSELDLDYLPFISTQETCQPPLARLRHCVAQWNCFIERGNAQPARAFVLQSPRTFHSSVAVSVGFHHSTDGHASARMLDDSAKVLPQIGEGDFRPSGAGSYAARNFCSACHCSRL